MDEITAPSLTPAQRKALKAQAHHLNPVVMIGDAGLTDAVLAEADRALRVHELIKIRVLGDDRAARSALMEGVCAALDCAPVQSIGKLLVVYRPRGDDEADSQAASKRKRRGPHRPKKAVGASAESRKESKKAAKTAGTRAAAGRKATSASGGRSGAARKASVVPGSRSGGAPKSRASSARGAAAAPASGSTRRSSSAAPSRGRGAGGVPPLADTRPKRPSTRSPSPAEPPARGKFTGERKMTATAKKSLSEKTAGKRTDLASSTKPPVRRGAPSKATQGPEHLQGKPGPRTSGRRDRAKSGS